MSERIRGALRNALYK